MPEHYLCFNYSDLGLECVDPRGSDVNPLPAMWASTYPPTDP
jgi:hypothetical protein